MSERLIKRIKFKFQKRLIVLTQDYLAALVGTKDELHWSIYHEYSKKWQRIANENNKVKPIILLETKAFEIFCEKIKVSPKISVILPE